MPFQNELVKEIEKEHTSEIVARINPKFLAFSAGKILLLGIGLFFVLSITASISLS
jgi:hypothetical protein